MTADPREAVLTNALSVAWEDGADGWGPGDTGIRAVRQLLVKLDAADPLRAMLGEVVEAAEAVVGDYRNGIVLHRGPAIEALDSALTRLRTLTPTEGGTDDA